MLGAEACWAGDPPSHSEYCSGALVLCCAVTAGTGGAVVCVWGRDEIGLVCFVPQPGFCVLLEERLGRILVHSLESWRGRKHFYVAMSSHSLVQNEC